MQFRAAARPLTAEAVLAEGRDDGVPALDRALAERLKAMVCNNFQPIYRVARRMLPPDGADDATQQTFLIATRKVRDIEPGAERAFLYKTVLRVVAHARRTSARKRQLPDGASVVEQQAGPHANPEQATSASYERRLLDEVLEAMPDDLRTVFVLFELEELSSVEIAPMLGIPVGTVVSRLRRAREEFQTQAKRIRARLAFPGGRP